ncbi:MAG: phage major capsid protein [Lactobacillus sp.]|nr:phage major capsid protein [Lactobacillus sp.]
MSTTLFEMKANLQTLGQQITKIDDEITQKAMDPKATRQDLKELRSNKADLQERWDVMNEQYGKAQKEQEKLLKRQMKTNPGTTAKEQDINKYADVIRQVMKQGTQFDLNNFKDVMVAGTGKGTENNDGKDGNAFLPINVASELISEPFAQNPLRQDATYTQIVNLILPRIAVEFGDNFKAINDGEAAKEADTKGDQVKFGRFESKVRIGITDAVLLGSPSNLVEYVNNALLNGASQYELARAFTKTPETDEEHMNFYDNSNKIKKITGTDAYTAIKKALADLDDAFSDNAKIYMTKTDYYDLIEKLANNSQTLYGRQPEEILGAPVRFTSWAVNPVIGDFSQYHGNYDPTSAMMEQYKDYDKGINYFQVTLWYDAQIKLASAFRIVDLGK